MKTLFLKQAGALAFLTVSLFSCAGSNDVADNTGLEPTNVVVTETEVASGTTPDGTTVVITDTDVVTDTTIMTPARENVANTAIDYTDMFDNVGDTEQYDLLGLARTNPNLSTFVQLVELSGMAPSLQAAEPVTVFAPTNAAFNALPKERLAELVAPGNRVKLVEFIKLHTLPSEVSSALFTERSYIDRAEGEDVPVRVEANGNMVYVGGAQLVVTDVEASNGILHVVDGIIETSEQAGPGLR
jgi:uncharacterized surface protein with fasciclin (FAS1) repeats